LEGLDGPPVEKNHEQPQPDNDQDYQSQKQIGAPPMLGLAVVWAIFVPGHDSHGSIEPLRNHNFSAD
jgi:hypothetical protein